MKAALAAVGLVLAIAFMQWRYEQRTRELQKTFEARLAALSARQDSAERAAQSGGATSSLATLRSVAALRAAAAARPPSAEDKEAPSQKATPDAPPFQPSDPVEARRKAENAMADVQSTLDAERRDPRWASDVESWLSSASGAALLGASHLQKVECKETLCSVEAVHDSEAAMQAWLDKFNGLEKGLPTTMTMPTRLPDGTCRTKTFLLKEGHQFPQHEP
jgi:hypothetical protein